MDWNQIICGDSFQIVSNIPDESVNLVLTSPPYWKQRIYTDKPEEIGQETSVEDYFFKLWQMFGECCRITKNDGSIVFNLGDRWEQGSMQLLPWTWAMCAVGWDEVRLINVIYWVKKNPTPNQHKRRLLSSVEPFFHFVKSKDYYYNSEAFQRKVREKKKCSSRVGQKYFNLIEESNLSDTEKGIALKELKQVINEAQKGEISGFRMNIRGIHAPPYGGQSGGRMNDLNKKGFTIVRHTGTSNLKRNVIETAVESRKGQNHIAVFPEKVVTELLYLLTKPEDIVFDPFCGSGTTCIAAKKLKRQYLGIDLNEKYVKSAQERLSLIS